MRRAAVWTQKRPRRRRYCCRCNPRHSHFYQVERAFVPASLCQALMAGKVSWSECLYQMACALSAVQKEAPPAYSSAFVSMSIFFHTLQHTVSFILFHFFFSTSIIRASSRRPASRPQFPPLSVFLSSLLSVHSFLNLARPCNLDPSE